MDQSRLEDSALRHGYFSAEKFRDPDSARQPPSLRRSKFSRLNPHPALPFPIFFF